MKQAIVSTLLSQCYFLTVLLHVYLAAIKTQPRLLAMCEHLPESNTKHPCVCSMGECPRLQTLWGTPATGQASDLSVVFWMYRYSYR